VPAPREGSRGGPPSHGKARLVEITVRNAQRRFPVDVRRLESLAGRGLKVLAMEGAQLSVLVVSDRRIRRLNRTYRQIDAPTDVLAFPQQEGAGSELHPGLLGDVVLSAETADRQAARPGWTLERELDTLLVHGLLHLAGFDHEASKEARAEMNRWKRKILRGWKG
jgi:probable rRNA maturation factor